MGTWSNRNGHNNYSLVLHHLPTLAVIPTGVRRQGRTCHPEILTFPHSLGLLQHFVSQWIALHPSSSVSQKSKSHPLTLCLSPSLSPPNPPSRKLQTISWTQSFFPFHLYPSPTASTPSSPFLLILSSCHWTTANIPNWSAHALCIPPSHLDSTLCSQSDYKIQISPSLNSLLAFQLCLTSPCLPLQSRLMPCPSSGLFFQSL